MELLTIEARLNDPSSRMTPLQIKVMMHMHRVAARNHDGHGKELLKRIKALKYDSLEELESLQHYVRNYAPIIIHVHLSRYLDFFLKDTHYRSQFETNASSGSLSRQSRSGWERDMFDGLYDRCTDYERVKYGTINFSNDPTGVQLCLSYGPSYFLLKEAVRDRITFTDKSVKSNRIDPATPYFCNSLLNSMTDSELEVCISASRANEISSGKGKSTMREIQVHGPVEFSKDI